ncbi:hypothetical protein [Paramicrobacterium chengjingii]|uniref:hypothetical protein n=1 Tax=Paramicrobacterium chengjingii TaxID=2769067 RepID=UPI0014238FAD|nr:hypothetical protein [Microbacterium chengjingii]
MSAYTPTTAEIREYVEVGGEPRPWEPPTPEIDAKRAAAFERWLAQVRAEARRDALLEAAEEFQSRLPDGAGNGRAYNSYRVAELLRALADKEQ